MAAPIGVSKWVVPGGAGLAALVDEQLELGPGQVVAAHPMAVVVDERGEQGVTHRVGQVYGEHAADSKGWPHAPWTFYRPR